MLISNIGATAVWLGRTFPLSSVCILWLLLQRHWGGGHFLKNVVQPEAVLGVCYRYASMLSFFICWCLWRNDVCRWDREEGEFKEMRGISLYFFIFAWVCTAHAYRSLPFSSWQKWRERGWPPGKAFWFSHPHSTHVDKKHCTTASCNLLPGKVSGDPLPTCCLIFVHCWLHADVFLHTSCRPLINLTSNIWIHTTSSL